MKSNNEALQQTMGMCTKKEMVAEMKQDKHVEDDFIAKINVKIKELEEGGKRLGSKDSWIYY